jgi:DNA-binding transcriptional MerR regulator
LKGDRKTLKPKEIQKTLGINADRIKFFKREGVFTPENPPSGNHSTEYTESDLEALRRLVVMTKMGLTCSDICKMQKGECTLEAVVLERRKNIEADITKQQNALSLLSELLERKEKFESFHTEQYWEIITKRESRGEEFIDPEDMYDYRAVTLIRRVICPYCGEEMEVDLEDYETDISSYDNEIGMGEDMVYSFDSEDNIKCPACMRRYRVSGWIREYPIGAYDSEEVNVEKLT